MTVNFNTVSYTNYRNYTVMNQANQPALKKSSYLKQHSSASQELGFGSSASWAGTVVLLAALGSCTYLIDSEKKTKANVKIEQAKAEVAKAQALIKKPDNTLENSLKKVGAIFENYSTVLLTKKDGRVIVERFKHLPR